MEGWSFWSFGAGNRKIGQKLHVFYGEIEQIISLSIDQILATVALRFFDLPPCGETLGIHKKNRRDGKPPDLERQVHTVVQDRFQVAEHTLFHSGKTLVFFLCVMPWIIQLSMEM